MKARSVAVLSAVVLAIALYAALGTPTQDDVATQVASEVPTAEAQLPWPVGRTARFALDYNSTSQALFAGQRYKSVVRLQSDLVVRAEARRAAFSLSNVRKAEQSLDGVDLMTSPQVLSVGEAVVEYEASGAIKGIRIPEGSDRAFGQLIRHLVMELHVSLSSKDSWRADERTSIGVAESVYTRQGQVIDKTRSHYKELDIARVHDISEQSMGAQFKIQLAADGVANIEGVEWLSATDKDGQVVLDVQTELSLSRQSSAPATAPIASDAPLHDLDTPFISQEAKARLLDQRIAGLTADEFLRGLRTDGKDGTIEDHNRWLWRSIALLKKHPELAKKTGAIFLEAEATPKQKALIMDLLASAGHSQAESVMRALVTSAAAEDDYTRYLQALSFVEAPDPETVRLVSDVFEQRQGDVRVAASYTLGSLIDTAPKAIADEYNDRLANSLRVAPSDDERHHLLKALGNTNRKDNTALIAEHASSDNADVRRAAAIALRGARTDLGRRTLLSLATDPNLDTQRAALRALAGHELDGDGLAQLATHVQDGRIGEGAFHHLASAVRARSDATEVLEAMVDRGIADARLRNSIEGQLFQIQLGLK